MIEKGTRFIGFSPKVDLSERKTANSNSETEPYTVDEIRGYKVFTALLTQSGGENVQSKKSGDLTIGVTYSINEFGPLYGADFTNVGAPNNNEGTYFIATGTTPNSWGNNLGGEPILLYNTGAPVATVLENTIGNIWFTYGGVGMYFAKSNGLFITDKCYQSLSLNTDLSIPNGCLFSILGQGSSDLLIQTYNPTAEVAFDNQFLNTPIEIRVYN